LARPAPLAYPAPAGPSCPAVPVQLAPTLGIRTTALAPSISMNTNSRIIVTILALNLAACAGTLTSQQPAARPVDRTNMPGSSPECLAAKLPAGEPFPASAIPAAASESRQSGVVAVRYDLVAGTAQNLEVVFSSPAGVYDAAALKHAAKYRAPLTSTVRGCVTVIDVQF
jgi:hypothetical protein